MPQIEINKAACTGCDVCVEICPTDVLRLDSEKKAFAAYEQDCQACFLCEWDCAFQAIRIRGLGVGGPAGSEEAAKSGVPKQSGRGARH
jgi:NAD-dependent dihydropyrimidine dehydrogenase PreA subunit